MPPKRVPYGSTELSKEAIRVRRENPTISGDSNLVVVRFSWRPEGSTEPSKTVTQAIWNTSTIAHSEQELDQYFRDFRAARGKVELTVESIFSERQFCGPSGQDCQGLIYKSYPKAEKEFAFNYQMPPGIPRGEGPTTKNVIRGRIEAFRDSGEAVDDSTRRDPPPYDERSGGRVPGQVALPPKKTTGDQPATATPPQAASPTGTADPQQPAPAKPAGDQPSPATSTPAEPAPTKPAPPKPASSKMASTKLEAAAPEPTSPKTTTPKTTTPKTTTPKTTTPKTTTPKTTVTTEVGEHTSHSGSGQSGSTAKAVTGATASGLTGATLTLTMKQLGQLVEQNPQDKELAKAVDSLNKAMDVKSLVENPKGFVADKIKGKLIEEAFDGFRKKLTAARQEFETRFPSVDTLRKDPLDRGVSLDDYRKNHDKALTALRVPDARKAFFYVGLALSLKEDTPPEEVERRIAAVNRELAKLPGLREYASRYQDARDRYASAIFVVANQLNVRGDDLASQPAGLADDLRRRAAALHKFAQILEDMHRQLWESGLVVFAPALATAMDLETYSQSIGGLAQRLGEFARVVDGRQGEYDRELRRLQAESERMAAQAVRPF
jgi:hypothetical protein